MVTIHVQRYLCLPIWVDKRAYMRIVPCIQRSGLLGVRYIIRIFHGTPSREGCVIENEAILEVLEHVLGRTTGPK